MKKISITFVILLSATFGFSQADTINLQPAFSVLISPFTFQNQSPANLNSFLSNNGFPQAKKNFMSNMPIRLTFTGKKLLIGLERNFEDVFTKNSDVGRTIVNSSYSNLQIGYDISKNRNFRLFPTIGFGTMKYSVELANNSNKTIDFEDLISDSDATNRRKLFTNAKIIDLGMEIQSNFVGNMPFRMSLKAGYRLALKDSKWTSDYEIKNAPSDNLSGFYVQLGYSFGKNKRK